MQQRQINYNRIKACFLDPTKLKHIRHRSQEDLGMNDYCMWKAKSQEQEQIFRAIRASEMFSPERVQTFVKFNYRSFEGKSIDYNSAYQAVLMPKSTRNSEKILRGSMHVSDLWSEKNVQQAMGSLPFPKDRLKILHSYKRGKDLRIKVIAKRKNQNRLSSQ